MVKPALDGGPAELIEKLQRAPRIACTIFMFVYSGIVIYAAAEPFAEGLLKSANSLGIEEFLLVQWLAPLASEAPEFIVAILFTLRLNPGAGIGTLISSKVNQWTLLVGAIPIAYSWSSGSFGALLLDARQIEELFLTSAQSLFAVMVIVNLSFSVWEALVLFLLFATQVFIPGTEARYIYACFYIVLAVGIFSFCPSNRRAFLGLFKSLFKKHSA
ncbi:hypothetical protein A3G55_02015 [Candidatus Giovannonibacteria bacterium RIFCSPLOWO2_12_FULL_44_25]|uniref:Sodium/calcium exchanger membrane region domain-containing protein n=3 Tax=Parcubacteria group TaxID=1794811 RepID=A0A837IKD6_9BACT|nr:MAG: hypothetical protein UW15_C0024G0034 [Parcubacteria group bacterium GW2011_GWC1_44_10]KKT60218.1 MAG: hypothetical protein UW53_C0003G0129 [Candidatus Giovannonibacteria bacterium GW2011_GWA1_44_25]KKU12577.1 MAG: hypothetical protein UX18_C0018G0003 [Candidatus Azambacteria bacterium GW2011_GWC2_45_7b]KKU30065.1 MAG: hypothetical protein UX43_C0003G0158 [Candidatus Giovannonibacteria bacterium GW2011_GWB1_46_20]OGF49424.1 MAG: hypothetical protein A2120_03850 [Candidatus Giovannonibact